jgi:hypothetical protein
VSLGLAVWVHELSEIPLAFCLVLQSIVCIRSLLKPSLHSLFGYLMRKQYTAFRPPPSTRKPFSPFHQQDATSSIQRCRPFPFRPWSSSCCSTNQAGFSVLPSLSSSP